MIITPSYYSEPPGGMLKMLPRQGIRIQKEYEPFTTLLNAMDYTPSATVQKYIQETIIGLKLDGIWDKIDQLVFPCLSTQTSSLLNWKSPSDAVTTSGTISFTADVGFTGNGTNFYFKTGFNPAMAVNASFTMNIASYGVYQANTASEMKYAIGQRGAGFNGNIMICRRSDNGNMQAQINSAAASVMTGSVNNGKGLFSAKRVSSSRAYMYKDGTQVGTTTGASVALQNAEFYVQAYNENGTASLHTTNPIRYWFIGGDIDQFKLHTRMLILLNNLGL
jgi:hypothetical protein